MKDAPRELTAHEDELVRAAVIASSEPVVPPLSNILPDCMMPDGAEPCQGYRDLLERVELIKHKTWNQAIEECAQLADRFNVNSLSRQLRSQAEELGKEPRGSAWGRALLMTQAADEIDRLRAAFNIGAAIRQLQRK